MYIVLLGPPGSGKGTQGKMLSKGLNIRHLSTGDLFREILANPVHPLYQEVQIIKEGKLVSDEVVNRVVEDGIQKSEYKDGVIFDGYPRTVSQAQALDQILDAMEQKVDVVIDLQVSREVLLYRLMGRRVCPSCKQVYHEEQGYENCPECEVPLIQRDDDNESTIMARFEEYKAKTAPLQEYYQKGKTNYVDIYINDASKTPQEVKSNIMDRLSKLNIL